MLLKLGLIAAAVAAIGFLYWENLRAADRDGYNRCMAEVRERTDAVNRDILGVNTDALKRWIELQGRLRVLSVDATLGVKNIPACAVSECALPESFIDRLEDIRK
jgi:hypothetical protein